MTSSSRFLRAQESQFFSPDIFDGRVNFTTFEPTTAPADPNGVVSSWSYTAATGVIRIDFDGSVATTTSNNCPNWVFSSEFTGREVGALAVRISQIAGGANGIASACLRWTGATMSSSVYGIRALWSTGGSGQLAPGIQRTSVYNNGVDNAAAVQIYGIVPTVAGRLRWARAVSYDSGTTNLTGTEAGVGSNLTQDYDNLGVYFGKNDLVAGYVEAKIEYAILGMDWLA